MVQPSVIYCLKSAVNPTANHVITCQYYSCIQLYSQSKGHADFLYDNMLASYLCLLTPALTQRQYCKHNKHFSVRAKHVSSFHTLEQPKSSHRQCPFHNIKLVPVLLRTLRYSHCSANRQQQESTLSCSHSSSKNLTHLLPHANLKMHQYIISVATLIVGSTLHWPIRLGLPVTQFSHFFDEKKNHQISQVFKLMYEYHASAHTYIYYIYYGSDRRSKH